MIHLIQSLTATEKGWSEFKVCVDASTSHVSDMAGRLALHAQAQELQVSHSEAMQFLVRQVEKQLLRKVRD